MTEQSIAEVAAGLTKEQREAVYKALILLDGIAGSGIGHEGTDGQTVWSDDVWLGLYDAFFPERGGDDESLATLARSHLISQGADHDR